MVDENLFRMNLPSTVSKGEIAACKLQGVERLWSCWDIFTGVEKLWIGWSRYHELLIRARYFRQQPVEAWGCPETHWQLVIFWQVPWQIFRNPSHVDFQILMRVFHEYAQSLGSSPQDVVATIHFLNLYRKIMENPSDERNTGYFATGEAFSRACGSTRRSLVKLSSLKPALKDHFLYLSFFCSWKMVTYNSDDLTTWYQKLPYIIRMLNCICVHLVNLFGFCRSFALGQGAVESSIPKFWSGSPRCTCSIIVSHVWSLG